MSQELADEPEEGEIVDDFDVISDCSIQSSPESGKSVLHKDLLQDVSLSSISDSESDFIDMSSPNERVSRKRKHKALHRKCRKRRYMSSSDEYDNDDHNPLLQKQLQRAIRVDTSRDCHQNSLHTRLKAMLGKSIRKQDEEEFDEELNTLRTLALLSSSKIEEDEEKKSNNNEEKDAVKTFEVKEANGTEKEDSELIQLRLDALKSAVLKKAIERKKKKENDVNKENKEEVKNCDNINNNVQENNTHCREDKNISIEEDVDIMRAKLLASMSRQISSVAPSQTASVPNKATKPVYVKPDIKVKPLIINLKDSDSESDEAPDEKKTEIKSDGVKSVETNQIEEFLKKQRAEVEAKNKAKQETGIDKSILKLLPQSQQQEYQMLKRKLLLAKRKKQINKVQNGVAEKSKQKMSFQQTLKDMQVEISGRLQMKGKYKELYPLIQKVNQASIERSHCETHIKTLIDTLAKAKEKFNVAHKNYAILVSKLVKAKSLIDRNATLTAAAAVSHTTATIASSTPLKVTLDVESCDASPIVTETTIKFKDNLTERSDERIEQDEQKTEGRNADEEEGLRYVSPLDCKSRENTKNDPMTTYCPYELFGFCRDAECKYNHCAKA